MNLQMWIWSQSPQLSRSSYQRQHGWQTPSLCLNRLKTFFFVLAKEPSSGSALTHLTPFFYSTSRACRWISYLHPLESLVLLLDPGPSPWPCLDPVASAQCSFYPPSLPPPTTTTAAYLSCLLEFCAGTCVSLLSFS